MQSLINIKFSKQIYALIVLMNHGLTEKNRSMEVQKN